MVILAEKLAFDFVEPNMEQQRIMLNNAHPMAQLHALSTLTWRPLVAMAAATSVTIEASGGRKTFLESPAAH